MKNLKAKAVCVMLSASMAAMGLTGCGSDNVDGTKTAITVNDESITLGQANFMLRYQQATMYNYYSKMYSMYGMQMPSEMYDKEGDDGKTTGETFKEQSLDTVSYTHLMSIIITTMTSAAVVMSIITIITQTKFSQAGVRRL